jgi:hypothetical protein
MQNTKFYYLNSIRGWIVGHDWALTLSSSGSGGRTDNSVGDISDSHRVAARHHRGLAPIATVQTDWETGQGIHVFMFHYYSSAAYKKGCEW